MGNYKDYELLAQEIYQTFLAAEGFEAVRVQHNVKIKGRSGCRHQVDVFWEFEMGGVKHRVAIECKDFASPVPIGRVRDFFGVLSDIGSIKGIMLSQCGFQRGAIDFAASCGIELRELRFPVARDWEGRIRSIVFKVTSFSVEVKSRRPITDQEWVRANLKLPDEGGVPYMLGGHENEICVVDHSGERITDFYELKSRLPNNWAAGEGFVHTFEMGDCAFLPIPELGPVKITGVEFVYDIRTATETVESRADDAAKAILKDVQTGRIHFFDKAGGVRQVQNPDDRDAS